MDAVAELEKLYVDVLKLKDSIYKNQIFLNPTKKQEEKFYVLLKSIILRTKSYMDKYQSYFFVKDCIAMMHTLQEKNEGTRVSFTFEMMEENIDYFYEFFTNNKNQSSNFIASVDYSIFHSIRVILEKMYRLSQNRKKDESLDGFFENNNI